MTGWRAYTIRVDTATDDAINAIADEQVEPKSIVIRQALRAFVKEWRATRPADPAIEGYIRRAAETRGIDPDTAVQVARVTSAMPKK